MKFFRLITFIYLLINIYGIAFGGQTPEQEKQLLLREMIANDRGMNEVIDRELTPIDDHALGLAEVAGSLYNELYTLFIQKTIQLSDNEQNIVNNSCKKANLILAHKYGKEEETKLYYEKNFELEQILQFTNQAPQNIETIKNLVHQISQLTSLLLKASNNKFLISFQMRDLMRKAEIAVKPSMTQKTNYMQPESNQTKQNSLAILKNYVIVKSSQQRTDAEYKQAVSSWFELYDLLKAGSIQLNTDEKRIMDRMSGLMDEHNEIEEVKNRVFYITDILRGTVVQPSDIKEGADLTFRTTKLCLKGVKFTNSFIQNYDDMVTNINRFNEKSKGFNAREIERDIRTFKANTFKSNISAHELQETKKLFLKIQDAYKKGYLWSFEDNCENGLGGIAQFQKDLEGLTGGLSKTGKPVVTKGQVQVPTQITQQQLPQQKVTGKSRWVRTRTTKAPEQTMGMEQAPQFQEPIVKKEMVKVPQITKVPLEQAPVVKKELPQQVVQQQLPQQRIAGKSRWVRTRKTKAPGQTINIEKTPQLEEPIIEEEIIEVPQKQKQLPQKTTTSKSRWVRTRKIKKEL